MKRAESESLAKQTLHFYNNEGMRSVPKTCHYFEKLGYKYQTVARTLKRTLERGTTTWKPHPGRTPTVSSDANLARVKQLFDTKKSVSVRTAAKALGLKRSTLSDMKVHRLNIRSYVKQRAPKYRDGQQ